MRLAIEPSTSREATSDDQGFRWNRSPPEDVPDSWLEENLLSVFQQERDKILHTLHRMLRNRADAEDALQTAFLHSWRARDTLAGVVDLRAWIWRVAINSGRDLCERAWRRKSRPLDSLGAEPAEDSDTPMDLAIAHEQQELVREAILHLRPEEQEVFILRRDADLTYQQIAHLRGTPIATGKTHMRRALEKLRHILRDAG
ncbi:MAG: RNA polymerase sigma factor [Acidobacteria bacterium]|nr:MAG: RNA polymerase sigma factor [Acidobacteriota bacterium]